MNGWTEGALVTRKPDPTTPGSSVAIGLAALAAFVAICVLLWALIIVAFIWAIHHQSVAIAIVTTIALAAFGYTIWGLRAGPKR